MLGTRRICSDVRQVYVGLLAAGQLDLGLLRRFFQTLHGQRVAAKIDAAVFLELVGQIFNHFQVEIFTAQEGVTVGGQHFELVLAVYVRNFDDGQIESTTTQVVHSNGTITALLVQAISQGRSSRLVDDPFHFQASNLASILGRLALAVIEVRRHGDHRFGYLFTQVVFCSLLHFLQNFCRHLRRRHFLPLHLNPGVTVVCLGDFVGHHLDVFLNHVIFKTTTNQSLDGVQSVVRVGHRLTLG